MPFQPPPRLSTAAGSVLAAGIMLTVASCSHLTPLGPDPDATMPQRPQCPPSASPATTALTISVAGRTWVLVGFGTRFTGREFEVALSSRNQALQLQRTLAASG